jgi:DNA-binding SARP family transcriptional activator/ABC-type branched-subunit amino acid transport system substrate-binding protein
VEFRVLGPLEVTDGGVALTLGGPRQRLVLAYLVLEANRVVPTDHLIDRIWGDEPPDAARGALFAYISRLRKLLGAATIQARPPGYILLAERTEIDALRFADLVAEARRQTIDREAAAALLTEALDLWRGSPLSDLADHDALRPAITRLEEQHLEALEDRIDAEMDLGRHRAAVPLLEILTAEHPLRERLWSRLVLALYRSGRQGDALGAYHRARHTLVEELGIDPSPELRTLEEQVLKQDPALELPTSPKVAAGAPPTIDTVPAAGGTVTRSDSDAARDRRWVLPLLGGLAIIGLVVAADWWVGQTPGGLPPGTWTIGLDMPLSGPGAILGEPVRDAVQMSIDDLNAAGGVDGATLGLSVLDDAESPERAAENARAFVAEPMTLAMIGPWGSAATFPVIPLTNEAGLLECSPSSTHPGLTKPRDGALDLRAAHPDAINYVRLAPADDIQASALASFAYRDLAARSALVIDDTVVGGEIADAFEEEFTELGGTTVRRALNPGADAGPVLAPLTDDLNSPDLVFYGGYPDAGAAVRLAMADAGLASTPLLSWDALLEGSGAEAGSYLQRVGVEAAVGSYVAHASLPDQKFTFADAYRQRFGAEPDEYSAAGYACVQIIVAALRGIAAQGPEVEQVRELVRAYAVDPQHRYETVLGTVGFDANGDALQQFVTFYRVEASAAGGLGDWVVFKKQDFGPAP